MITELAESTASAVEKDLERYAKDSTKLLNLVVESIRRELDMTDQWRGRLDTLDNAAQHKERLEAYVELLEEFHCGSVGGFAAGQPPDQDLKERALWIMAKYKTYGKTSTPTPRPTTQTAKQSKARKKP